VRVRYTDSAAHDVEEILRYVREHSPAGAQAVQQALISALNLMAHFPQAGRRTEFEGVLEMSVGAILTRSITRCPTARFRLCTSVMQGEGVGWMRSPKVDPFDLNGAADATADPNHD